MSSSFLAAGLRYPAKFEDNLFAEMRARIEAIFDPAGPFSTEDVEALYNELRDWEPDGFCIDESGDDEGGELSFSPAVLMEALLESVAYLSAYNGEYTTFVVGDVHLMIAGGMSWGDNPSDAFAHVARLARADLFGSRGEKKGLGKFLYWLERNDRSEELDELVTDFKDNECSNINNSGYEEQVRYLLSHMSANDLAAMIGMPLEEK